MRMWFSIILWYVDLLIFNYESKEGGLRPSSFMIPLNVYSREEQVHNLSDDDLLHSQRSSTTYTHKSLCIDIWKEV
jgi:hypothetical protein